MKKLNVFIKVALTSFMITFLCFSGKIYGAQLNSDQYMMLYGKGNGRPTGFYWVSAGNKANKPVIKVVKSSDSNGTSMKNESSDEAIFCIKDGIGFGSSDGANGSTASVVNYNQYFDMRKPDEIASPYKNNLPQDNTNYKKLMWVLEHSVNPSDTAATAILLNEAGISDNDFNNYKQADFNNNSIDKIKKDVIEVAQQAAIWHYTNSGTDYDPGNSPNFFRTNNNTGDTAINIDDLYNGSFEDDPITVLYSYFIKGADEATNYDYTQSGLTEISLDKSSVVSKTEGTNFIIGPYKINKTGNDNFNLVATITDGTNALNNAKILKSDKTTEINGANYSEKVKNSIGSTFYISVPVSDNLSKVVLSISGNTTGKTITYWSAPAAQISVTQPIAIVKNETKSFKDSDEQKVYNAKFDLALRKFIVSINGVAPSVSREPVISQDNLKALANGTAEFDSGNTVTKTHTKDPLTVKAGDKVVYTIRVYNEGEIDGKATEIADYLPEGLTLTQNSTINNKYGWKADSTNSKKITSTYLANTNLAAFNKTPADGNYKISYADVQVECDVIPNLTSSTKLKNVAEISKDSNAENKSDRDSTPGKLTEDQIKNYNPGTSTRGKGYEDDDDYEDLKPVIPVNKQFDLALRKFIVSINGVAPKVSREPVISQDNLKALANGTANTFDKTTTYKEHTKDPLAVSTGDKVVYTIRIYNEGDVDGKATEITDYLPDGLKLAENSEINKKYGWQADANNAQAIKTAYLSNTTLKAFNKTLSDGKYVMTKEGGQIADVQIECEVTATSAVAKHLKNVAEISKEENAENLKDRDSTPGNLTENQIKNYNPGTSTKGKGYEDDDDYEDLLLSRFDLALRKFITGVNDQEITNREPQVDTSKFGTIVDGKEVTTCTYNHTKEPVRVEHNDIVTYTIRIYNEGTVDGYAAVVKDDLPEGIVYLPEDSTNIEYRWKMYDADGNETDDVTKAAFVTTDYLSKEQEKTTGSNLLKAFDKDNMDTPDYRDVKIAFRVTMPNTSDRIVINKAQISKHTDSDGKEPKDTDSVPDKWNDGEDDQDIEKIYVKYFDLALRKWVTQAIVIEDGQEKVMDTGHKAEDDPESVVKVEINKKRLKDTVVKFRYSIRITNEGEIAGYATEISDYIPKGLKFNQADNPQWREVNGKIVTNALKDTLLQPGEQGFVDVLLTWENDENNMGVMTNVAEISEDKNESDTPDIDSTPNNKKDGEDDIDDAPVALTVNAGKAPTYFAMIAGVLSIIGTGAILIKKFVI